MKKKITDDSAKKTKLTIAPKRVRTHALAGVVDQGCRAFSLKDGCIG
jgi:hypothetical protein